MCKLEFICYLLIVIMQIEIAVIKSIESSA